MKAIADHSVASPKSSGAQQDHLAPWTAAQRRGLAILLILVALALGIVAYRNPMFVSDPAPDTGPRAGLLADTLDPNTATAAELAAIPNVGEKRAAMIVAYRAMLQKEHPGAPAFTSIDDLAAVKGVGPATLALLKQHLKIDPDIGR
jgi:hypothetical protein